MGGVDRRLKGLARLVEGRVEARIVEGSKPPSTVWSIT